MNENISKIGIVNRGEIAVRIIQACKELGLKTALLHSEVDKNTLAYRLSDEKVCIGSAEAKDTYLHIEKIILALKSLNIKVVHPGVGFLSESPDFMKACKKNQIAMIGPSLENIELFSDKLKTKTFVSSLKIPTLPSDETNYKTQDEWKKACEKIGLPVLVKNKSGGGGKGIRKISELSKIMEKIESSKKQGKMFFDSDEIYLEKYLENARHIEAQIFRDISGKTYFLGFRDCSIQENYGKIIEESPVLCISSELKEKMKKASLLMSDQSAYEGLGTVEFLVQKDEFYFLEFNPRLQVEHGITEMTYGIDLVKAQMLYFLKKSVLWEDLKQKGFCIETRIYARDVFSQKIPTTGKLSFLKVPCIPGLRLDLGFEKGDEISSYYDGLIAKLICYDENRNRAIEKMKSALKQTIIFGVGTNIPFLLEILSDPDYISNKISTEFLKNKKPKFSDLKNKEEILKEIKENKTSSQEETNPWFKSSWE